MPELPEVDVVRAGVDRHVRGRTIARAGLTGPRVARRHPGGAADLASQVAGLSVRDVDRRGKYLWLVLQDPADVTSEPAPERALALIVHLGMSGQLLLAEPGAADPRHLHARFTFTDAGPELRFVDQRTFGGLALTALVPDPWADPARTDSTARTHPFGVPDPVAHIAPDPWEAAFDARRVAQRARARSSGIKRLLLDQGLVSGIGNIYADEALWRARIHGERPASALTGPAIQRLLGHAGEVMSEAAVQGGTSFDALYVNVNGASGYFDRSLHVYGRGGTPCDRCGATIRRESFMNRSSYSCPRCQPRPRVRRAARS